MNLFRISFFFVVLGLPIACETAPDPSGNGGTGGAGGAETVGVGGAGGGGGGGGGPSCEPFEKRPCYTGPAETRGVGDCTEGFSICNALGTGFGFCEGQITPGPESCERPGDEDCDGVADEGCP